MKDCCLESCQILSDRDLLLFSFGLVKEVSRDLLLCCGECVQNMGENNYNDNNNNNNTTTTTTNNNNNNNNKNDNNNDNVIIQDIMTK